MRHHGIGEAVDSDVINDTMDANPKEDSLTRRLSVSDNDDLPPTRFQRATSVSQFLDMPPCPSKDFPPKNKGSSNVLTSEENMAKMEEKERLKEEKKQDQERRKAAREAKAKAKLQQETTSKSMH